LSADDRPELRDIVLDTFAPDTLDRIDDQCKVFLECALAAWSDAAVSVTVTIDTFGTYVRSDYFPTLLEFHTPLLSSRTLDIAQQRLMVSQLPSTIQIRPESVPELQISTSNMLALLR
jgi:hypothetical protein